MDEKVVGHVTWAERHDRLPGGDAPNGGAGAPPEQSGTARTPVNAMLSSDAGIVPDASAERLTLRLVHQARRGHDLTLAPVHEELNRTRSLYPGTSLRLICEILPHDPGTGRVSADDSAGPSQRPNSDTPRLMCARLTGRKVEGASPLNERPKLGRVLREPCVTVREGRGEASVAVRAGSAMERRKSDHPGCRGVINRRRQHGACRYGEARPGPAASKNTGTHVRLSPGPGRPPIHPAGSPAGSLREGRICRSRGCTERRSQTGA